MAKPDKNKKVAAPAAETSTATTNAVAQAPATAAATKAKKTKAPKVEIPLTTAQAAAKAALDKANEEARQELIANSAGKIAEADAKIAAAIVVLNQAKAERKALNKAMGVKGVFGGKKISTLVYVKDFPEGKGAPQARQILEIIKAAGKDGLKREAVVETMKTVISTNMDRSRLLSFYCSKMIAAGVIAGS